MKVCILGPFRLEDGSQQVVIGGIRRNAVLARRLVDANQVAPGERLLSGPGRSPVPELSAGLETPPAKRAERRSVIPAAPSATG